MTVTDHVGTEFGSYLAALPAQYESQMLSDTVATAFWKARRAGWSVEQLAGDAVSTLNRGGIGLVVRRLNDLANNAPTKRTAGPAPKRAQHAPLPECASCGTPYRRGSQSDPTRPCVSCGEPLSLTVFQTRWS